MGKQLRIRLTIFGLVFLLVLTSSGCSKADKLLSITVSPNKVLLLSGGMHPLSVNASYESGTVISLANWTGTSSNPAVATLDTTGYIKAVTAGSTNLTIAYQENGVSKSVVVPVQVETAPKHPAVYYISE